MDERLYFRHLYTSVCQDLPKRSFGVRNCQVFITCGLLHQMANHDFVSEVKGTPPTSSPVHRPINVAENAEDITGDISLSDSHRNLHSTEQDDNDKVVGTSDKRLKKSLFEITSVVNTENDFSRGESMGNDVEDTDLDDTLSEPYEVSTPNEPVPDVSSRNTTNHHQGSVISRFRIVKITRTEPYKKGRWTCHEFSDSPPENKGERKQGINTTDPSKPTNGNPGQSNKPHMGARLKDNPTFDGNSANTETVADSSAKHHGQSTNSAASSAPSTAPEGGRTYSNQKLVDSYTNISNTLINSRTLQSNADEPISTAVSESTFAGFHDRAPSRTGEPRSRSSSCHSGNSNEDSTAAVPVVKPIVDTIESALDQITHIRSTILTVVKDEITTLKETITKLKAENSLLKEEIVQLKDENERFRKYASEDSISADELSKGPS